MLSGSDTASPSFTIPADYIESDTSASTDVVVQLRLASGRSQACIYVKQNDNHHKGK